LKVTKRTDTDTTDEKVLHAVYIDAKIYETLYQQLKYELQKIRYPKLSELDRAQEDGASLVELIM
jgi:hypothetical protein